MSAIDISIVTNISIEIVPDENILYKVWIKYIINERYYLDNEVDINAIVVIQLPRNYYRIKR